MENCIHYNSGLHKITWLTSGATFLLILIGAIVTGTDSGLAVPDWPTTFGYNMFLYPLSEMVDGILYEHSHRLMGSLVGVLTIALFISLLARDPRNWMKWIGLSALIAVVVQGVLGGLRVTQINRDFAIVHACLAQAFFALLCGLIWFTSRDWWLPTPEFSSELGQKLRRLSLITTGLIYLQLVFGAILRHTGSRLDAHLLFAFLVALHIFLLARRLSKTIGNMHCHNGIGQTIPMLLLGLLAIQLMLGTAAFFVKLTPFGETLATAFTVTITTTHVAVGALMLATSFVLTLKIYKFTNASGTVNAPASDALLTE